MYFTYSTSHLAATNLHTSATHWCDIKRVQQRVFRSSGKCSTHNHHVLRQFEFDLYAHTHVVHLRCMIINNAKPLYIYSGAATFLWSLHSAVYEYDDDYRRGEGKPFDTQRESVNRFIVVICARCFDTTIGFMHIRASWCARRCGISDVKCIWPSGWSVIYCADRGDHGFEVFAVDE